MKLPVTQTKIIVPRRISWTWSRSRLIAYLDDLLDYRLTLIAAPAGYGKTTLLVDLAHQVEYPVCWFALDPLDQDLVRFLTHFVAAIQKKFPQFGTASTSVISNLASTEINQNQILSTIVNDLYENIQEHFALVLDDYYLVDSNSEINQFINHFAREMDENCHLVIASRSLLSLPDLPLLVGRSQVKGVSFEELAFRSDEIKALLTQKYDIKISDQESRKLMEDTEGWITGLLLSAETAKLGLDNHGRAPKTTGVDLYDYLTQQVLEQQDPLIQEFLLQSSLLEEFDTGLLEDVLGPPQRGDSWQSLISHIQENHLFVLPVESEGTWLRYHHLFRDFLQDRFHRQHPGEEEQLLHRLLAVYQERSWWEKAYAICQRLGDEQLTARLIQAASGELYHNGQWKLLASWLDELPENLINTTPALLSIKGSLVSMLGSPEEGLETLDRALALQKKNNNPNQYAQTLIRRSTCQRLLGHYLQGLEDAEKAFRLASGSILEAEAEREIGLLHRRLGNLEAASHHLYLSLQHYQDQNDPQNTAFVEMDLGSVAMDQGNYRSAERHYKTAYQTWESLGSVPQLVILCNNLGVLDHLAGSYRDAFNWFTQALEYARSTGSKRGQAFTLASLGDLVLDLGAITNAEAYYASSHSVASEIGEQFLISYLELSQAALERIKGKPSQAFARLEEVDRLLSQAKGIERGKYYQESGFLLIDQEQPKQALTDFEKAAEIYQEIGMPFERAVSLLCLVVIAHKTASSHEILHYIENAQTALRDAKTLSPLVAKLSRFQNKLTAVNKQVNGHPLLEKLITEIERFEEKKPEFLQEIQLPSPMKSLKKVPALDIKALGRIAIQRFGERVVAPEWTNQKTVRELFFFLISQEIGASREEICAVFWPDSSPEQMKKQFKNAIYRLRRALGKDTVLYHQPTRVYHFNRTLSYSYDVEAFQELISRAENEESPEKKIQLLQAAAECYHHPFAPTLDGIWVEPERYRLYRCYERLMVTRAELYLSRNDFDAALEVCKELLQVAPSHEKAYRIAMRAQAEKGDRGGITREFQRCKNALSDHLDTQPSPETIQLYNELIG